MDLKELESVDPASHWYYQSKLSALLRVARRYSDPPQRILDVGAGSGFFGMEMARSLKSTGVVCVDPNYDDSEVGQRDDVEFVRVLPVLDEPSFDLLLFIDVLEHVLDDVGLLTTYVPSARPGALVLISVPAFSSLWSAHDVFLEHVRRYRLQELQSVATRAGLQVLHGQYLFAGLFPPAWIIRRARRDSQPKSDLAMMRPATNALLRAYFSWEGRLRHNRVAGLTALVAARIP